MKCDLVDDFDDLRDALTCFFDFVHGGYHADLRGHLVHGGGDFFQGAGLLSGALGEGLTGVGHLIGPAGDLDASLWSA